MINNSLKGYPFLGYLHLEKGQESKMFECSECTPMNKFLMMEWHLLGLVQVRAGRY